MAEQALAVRDPAQRLTLELAATHVAAYRAQGFDSVALRTADSKLELGAWPLASADPSTIQRHALSVARGQRTAVVVQMLFRGGERVESELYEVVDERQADVNELALKMLAEAFDHQRKMNATLERLMGAQVTTLTGMWDFAQAMVGTASRERAELVEELIERRRDEDGGDRAMRIMELVIPALGPQAGALIGALAKRIGGEDDGEATDESPDELLRGRGGEAEGAGTELADGEARGAGVEVGSDSDG